MHPMLRRPLAAPILGATLAAALLAGPIQASPADAAPVVHAASSSPRSWYVACGAPGGGDGTAARPWNALQQVNGHGAFLPGERILLKRGTTCRGRLTPGGSGSAGSPIVLGAYGRGARPLVSGGGTPNRTGAVQLTNQHDWTVQDLHITNATAALTRTYRSGLLLLNSGGGRLARVTAQRLLVEHVSSNPAFNWNDPRQWGGISVLTSGGHSDGFDGLRLLHNEVDHVGRTGIMVQNAEYPRSADMRPRIAYNAVRWARGDSIVMRGARSGRIDHNVSAHGAAFWPCPQCKGISPATANAGIWTAASDRVVIERNEVYGEHRLGGDGEAFDIDQSATGTIVQYNYAHDNEGGGVLVCAARDARIRFNILQNNGRAAIFFTCHRMARNIAIYNNTIVTKRGVTSYIVRHAWHKAVGVRFFNNLVYNSGAGRYVWPSRPKTAANTFVGVHDASEPRGRGTSHVSTNLRDPGHGRIGMRSLSGYRVRSTRHAQRGLPVPSVRVDFFGKPVNAEHPIRGASSS